MEETKNTAAAENSTPEAARPEELKAADPVQADLLERIERTIDKIRPYIQHDGGDVQLVDYQDGVVTVRMMGACAGCMSIDSTLTDGIQAILIDEVPEVNSDKLDTSFAPYSYY